MITGIIIAVLLLLAIGQFVNISRLNKTVARKVRVIEEYACDYSRLVEQKNELEEIVVNLTEKELANVNKRIAKKRDKGLKVN